jgi:hypothetical protein
LLLEDTFNNHITITKDKEQYLQRRKGGDIMVKKDLVIAILATFCLTATLFLIIPIRSASLYDPILDVNHDRKIDIKDIAAVAKAFGTTGDPTLPVNVTNWPVPSTLSEYLGGELNLIQGINLTDWTSQPISLDGYRTYYLYRT